MPTTVDFLAAWVPFFAEPGDAVSLDVTVPSGYETGTWTGSIWRDKRKGTAVATFTVAVNGQVVTLTLSSATTTGLVPSGASAFSGYWELDRTASSTPRTWLKGDFILDPSRRSTSSGAQAITADILNNAITVTSTAVSGGGGGGGYSTPSQVLNALITVDGAGSGLDADLFDGADSSTFVKTTGAQSVAGVKTFSSTPVVPDASWTLAKIANIATARLLGRTTSGSGVIEELDATTAKALLAIAAGDVSGLGALATLSAVGSAQITDGSIVDGDINASAAIALTKLAAIADQRLLGNVSGSSAPAAALTAAQVKTFLALAIADVASLQATLDGKQPLDSDLTTIAGLTPTNGDTLQYVSGAWANRTASQARTTLGLGNLATATTLPVEIGVACSDETTAITTGTAKATFRLPYAMTLTAVRASLTTASSSGLVTVDINESGTTVLSTKLTIDQSERTSTTAATPAVISDASLADDAEVTIDVDGAGTNATGLKVWLIGTRAAP